MNEVQFTADHLIVAGQVLARAPASLAEQMVIQELFVALEAMLPEAEQAQAEEQPEERFEEGPVLGE